MPSAENLLIRADAGPRIGVGHVMRCLALAQQWRAGEGRVTFACAELTEPLRERLCAEGAEVRIIDAPIGSLKDARATLNLSRDLGAVVVADGYRFSVDFQKAVHKEAKALLVLDDFGQIGTYCADLILDQNLGAIADTYVNRSPDCRLLLGPEYVMLRREFLDAGVDRHQVKPTVHEILVTTGGADVGNLAGKILDVVNDIPDSLNITLVVGGAGCGTGVIEEQVKSSHHQIRLNQNVENMHELMAMADLAISAAGSTVWELAYMGIPAVLVVVAENQRVGASALEKLGASLVFDGSSGSVAEEIRQALGLLIYDQPRRSLMSGIAKEIVDGKGAARVVRAVTCVLE